MHSVSKRQQRRIRKKNVENIMKYLATPSSSNVQVNQPSNTIDHNEAHSFDVDIEPQENVHTPSDMETESESSNSPCNMFEHFSDFSSYSSDTFKQNSATYSELLLTFFC